MLSTWSLSCLLFAGLLTSHVKVHTFSFPWVCCRICVDLLRHQAYILCSPQVLFAHAWHFRYYRCLNPTFNRAAGGEEAAGGPLLLHAASDHEEESDTDDDDTNSETDGPAAPDGSHATPDVLEDSPDSEERSLEWQVRNLAADNAKLKAKVQQLMMLQEENVQLREVCFCLQLPVFPLLFACIRKWWLARLKLQSHACVLALWQSFELRAPVLGCDGRLWWHQVLTGRRYLIKCCWHI